MKRCWPYLGALAVCIALRAFGAESSLWADFRDPPPAAKPWCYYWWINGHVDHETIAADLESMKELGFGGILLFDSRGYFDDEDHVVNPKAELDWGSPAWYDHVAFTIRECARLGLTFTMNASASGGWLNGFVNGREYTVDVLKRADVVAHLDRVIGPLEKRVPELIGAGRTFTHIYSVSYEGGVKTGGTWGDIKDSFYATMRSWAHAHGFQVYSESGGPWAQWAKGVKLDCSQLDMLAHNDFPQGEFWPLQEYAYGDAAKVRHANQNGRFFQRGIVLAARRDGRNIVSMESFTHMMRHYSVDPALLKPLADIAFADGANRIVWHTFTCSPKKFGVPGAEYFAGSHINRNVTWQKDAAPFVKYLGRCSHLLQQGRYVDDGEFASVATNYYNYNATRYRANPRARFTATHRRIGPENGIDLFFVAGEGRGELPLNCRLEGRPVEVWNAVTGEREAARLVGDGAVSLDLPVGGSCFVVVGDVSAREGASRPCPTRPPSERSSRSWPVVGPWRVSFAYHPGITASPPSPIALGDLVEWTTRDDLRHFSGTATYRTTVSWPQDVADGRVLLALGDVPTGVAHVFVNGIDCGVAWCDPWEVDISAAVLRASAAGPRPTVLNLEIRYTNNWYNRLVGDCLLPPEKRVTKSTLRYWQVERKGSATDPWRIRPTIYSGPSAFDRLQRSGLLGPVAIRRLDP